MNQVTKIIPYLIFFEILSLNAHLNPVLGSISFFTILCGALLLSVIDLKYGVWIMLAELFIGSKGYLFLFNAGGTVVSIRIAIWLTVMSVWLAKLALTFLSKRQGKQGDSYAQMSSFFNSEFFSPILILFIFIAWGIVSGLMNGNGYSNIFFDMNGWVYFLAIFPIYAATATRDDLRALWNLLTASIIWLGLKTYFILFIFSHNNPDTLKAVYKWVRNSGVGEITKMEGGFYRIFFQSHIYLLIGMFLITYEYFRAIEHKALGIFKSFRDKKSRTNFLITSIAAGGLLISFSRSFWIGLIIGLIAYFIIIVKDKGFKNSYPQAFFIAASFICGFVFILATVKFPFPKSIGGFNAGSLIINRASEFSNEAAVSSRWSQLPKLWSAIADDPVLGKGFGATVTYKSSDPRVLAQNPDGNYNTFAFEWGWLDIWFKLGFFGFITYIILIVFMIFKGLVHMPEDKSISKFCHILFLFFRKLEKWFPSLSRLNDAFEDKGGKTFVVASVVGLILISAVNFFTPYLNHPLGIGFIILSAITIEALKDNG